MRFVFQFLIIMVFAFLGELLHHFIPLPIPASIYGIVLLFLALETKILKVSDIKETSSFLIAIMPLMFLLLQSESSSPGICFEKRGSLMLSSH